MARSGSVADTSDFWRERSWRESESTCLMVSLRAEGLTMGGDAMPLPNVAASATSLLAVMRLLAAIAAVSRSQPLCLSWLLIIFRVPV